MDAKHLLRALLRNASLRAVALAILKGISLEDLITQVEVEGKIVRTSIEPIPPPLELRAAQQNVIDAARGKGWILVKGLARTLGYGVEYTRKIVASLVRLGVFERGPDGVRLDESAI